MSVNKTALSHTKPVLWQGRYWLLAQWVFPVSSPALQWAGVSWLAENNPMANLDAPWQYNELPEALKAALPNLKSIEGRVLTPGWVNAHTHLEQWAEAALPKQPEMTFADWLFKVVETNRQHPEMSSDLQAQAKQAACLQSMAAMQSSGVTCVADISSEGASLEVLNKAGWRGQIALEVLAPFALAEQTPQIQARLEAYVQRFKSLQHLYQGHSRLTLGLSPHSVYNVHPQTFAWLQEQTGAQWFHMHLGECPEESDWLKQAEGSGFARLQQKLLGRSAQPVTSLGASKPEENTLLAYWWQHYAKEPASQHNKTHWLLAHGCQISPQQWQAFFLTQQALLDDKQSLSLGLAHCPQSNLALHGQSLKPWGALTTGEKTMKPPLGLGTDGRLSTPSLDLRVEARLAETLHQWQPEEVLEALTLSSAKALGLQNKIGALAVGLEADLALWQVSPSQAATPQQALSQLWQQETTAFCLQRWVQGKPFTG